MISQNQKTVKTTTPIHKVLLDEIDQFNPFKTRREFFEAACRHYIQRLKKEMAYRQLEEACKESAEEDLQENANWERPTLETWQ
jgi:metal-responsive CopG/Arc/MetJ family transcriptional regulator